MSENRRRKEVAGTLACLLQKDLQLNFSTNEID